MTHSPVIIVGAGLAGLSAAVECCAAGKRVMVFEQHQYAGGRARSFRDETTGDEVDNGQHLLMGCYAATRRYLRLIGSDHLAFLQPTLRIPYLHAGHAATAFAASPLPAPLHVLTGFLRFDAIPFRERIIFWKLAFALLRTSREEEHALDAISADEWLRSLHQGEEARRYLWDVIAIGALNEHPKNVSALLFYRVLRAAFFGHRQNASFLIPCVGLSELLVDPALRFIKQHGGSVRFSTEISELVESGGRATGVRTSSGEFLPAEKIIVAVPWYSIESISRSDGSSLQSALCYADSAIRNPKSEIALSSSTIISIQMWFDRRVMEEPFAAVIDQRIHWVFARKPIAGTGQILSLVISGANSFADTPKEQLVRNALEELSSLLPQVSSSQLLHSLIIKEKRATFVPRPGLESVRPSAATNLANVFLAGDWTSTGYPATIEGAVISGMKAGVQVSKWVGALDRR